MQESCTYGSMRGAPSNGRPYRNRERGHRFELFAFVYVPETVRVLTQRSTLLGNRRFEIAVPPGQWGELPITGKRPRLGRTA
jgi:hypothetical protein